MKKYFSRCYDLNHPVFPYGTKRFSIHILRDDCQCELKLFTLSFKTVIKYSIVFPA